MSDPQAPAPQDPHAIPWEEDVPTNPPDLAQAPPEQPQEPPAHRVEKVGREEAPRPSPPIPEPAVGGAPPWALIPPGLRAPRGRAVYFARFPSAWTDTPREGVPGELSPEEAAAWQAAGMPAPTLFRQCVFWPLSLGDQALALGRANGDPNRFNAELCKQMIRAVDGVMVDRTGEVGEGSLDLWWTRVGERCRSELTRMCTRIHSLTTQERSLFFAHCVAARTAG